MRAEGQRQRQRRRKERQREHEVEGEEPAELGAVPGDLQRIEGQRLGHGEGRGRARPEAQRGSTEGPAEAGQEDALEYRDQAARRAEAQQRHGDDHVGKVVPVHDRQQARQQDLVAQHAGGEQCHGDEESGPGEAVRSLARHAAPTPVSARR